MGEGAPVPAPKPSKGIGKGNAPSQSVTAIAIGATTIVALLIGFLLFWTFPGLVTDWVAVSLGSNGIGAQVWIQLKAVLLTVVWSGVVAFISFKIADMVIGLRVTEEEEREGLDISSHGETAYTR
jgi:ammonia channel protein AmtB